jgi:YVTN family beta-propeller protein
MKWGKKTISLTALLAFVALLGGGCSSSSVGNTVTVAVTPSQVGLIVKQTQAFTALVNGATNSNVTWTLTINGKDCTPSCGAIDSTTNVTVTYTAPATVPSSLLPTTTTTNGTTTVTPPPPLLLTATSVQSTKASGKAQIFLDSGIRVTITPTTATVGTGEQFKFTASVTNDATGAVSWALSSTVPNTTAASSSFTCSGCGSIDDNGFFTAPSTVPTTASFFVVATSKVDPSRFGAGTITVVSSTGSVISFTGVTPPVIPQGAVQQDLYLNVQNLRSTVQVFFNAQLVDPNSGRLKVIPAPTGTCTSSSTTTCPSSLVARLRLQAADLAVPPGPYPVTIKDAQGKTYGPINVTVKAYRPGLVSSVPDSFPFSASGPVVNLDGGLFGSATNPNVTTQFNGQTRSFSVNSARQLAVNLNQGDLATPGLYSLGVTNTAAAPSTAVTNVAVQPDFANSNPVSPATPGTLSLVTGAHPNPAPTSIAVDNTGGYAVIAEPGANAVQFLSLAGGAVALGGQVGVGNNPTSVAIDNRLSPPVAAVVNSTDSTLSIVQVQPGPSPTGSVIATVNLAPYIPAATGSATPPKPFAVGIDPFTHLALVAFSSTNVGFIVNVAPSAVLATEVNPPTGCLPVTPAQSLPYCAIASVTLNTGALPQIAFEPQLHLAYVTPGGSGTLSVVDLTQRSSQVPIAQAPSGAVLANNIVTIKTTGPNNINPAVGGTVLISGLPPGKNGTNFNGSFAVLSVVDANDFTYSFPGAAASATDTGGSSSTQTGFVGFGNPLLTFSVSNTIEGVAINRVTRTAALADPNAGNAQVSLVSTLDQNVTSLGLSVGSFLNNPGSGPEIGARFVAFQPNTNTLVSFNPLRNEISVLDPVAPQRLAPAIATGQTGIGSYTLAGSTSTAAADGALAIDPTTNLALVANSGSNTLSIFSLGANVKPAVITQALVTSGGVPGAILPQAAVTSSSAPATVQILGAGFVPGAQVRLDGTIVGSSTVVSDREIDVTIPASFLSVPRRYALDVLSNGVLSNATEFTVVGTVSLSSACGSAAAPGSVAIDDQRDIALVGNTGCGNISIISLKNDATFGAVTNTVAVGKSPAGIATIPRLGLALVANSGDGTASIINEDTAAVTKTVTVGTSPNGVAINQDTGLALVANTGSNTVSQIDLNASSPTSVDGAVDQQPIAVAINPDGNNGNGQAVVTAVQLNGAAPAQGVLDVVNLSSGAPSKSQTLGLSGLFATPTGVAFDPVANPPVFYVTASGFNLIFVYDPASNNTNQVKVGVNPTSIAYNFQTSTALTVNSASNTVSVLDSQTLKTRATVGISGSSQYAAAIHPRTNLAVIADSASNRVLLYPLPK